MLLAAAVVVVSSMTSSSEFVVVATASSIGAAAADASSELMVLSTHYEYLCLSVLIGGDEAVAGDWGGVLLSMGYYDTRATYGYGRYLGNASSSSSSSSHRRRREQMEIGPNKWKSVQTNENRSKQM